MLVPSIDLMDGHAVQLIGGEERALDAGDPMPIAERFGRVGEVAVIDLDAALGRGSNADVIKSLLRSTRARVGGGIRSYEAAVEWLDAGAQKVILGTAARPELLARLPRERVIAALDARDGEVVVEGWQKRTGEALLGRIAALRDHVGGFLVTFVEREGRLGGTDLELARAVIEAAGTARVTIAGGVTTAEEIRALDAIGADAQVGMALYTGRLSLAEAFAAPLRTDRADGLYATVVTDERGHALGLAWSSLESLAQAIDAGKGVYRSRSRDSIWVKGASSGATQDLLRVDLDCDRDVIRFVVRQHGEGFCHLGTPTCWGDVKGLTDLARTLGMRRTDAPAGSYTARLFADRALLDAKLREEAEELTQAQRPEDVVHEAADVLFFTLARLTAEGISLAQVEAELDRRALKVTRRE